MACNNLHEDVDNSINQTMSVGNPEMEFFKDFSSSKEVLNDMPRDTKEKYFADDDENTYSLHKPIKPETQMSTDSKKKEILYLNDVINNPDTAQATKNNDNNPDDVNLYDYETTRCGIGTFKPQWLQQYATPRVYLVLYCIVGLLEGMNYTYFAGCLSTIEKRFAFNSKISGYIMLSREILPLVFGIPVSYFGGRLHKPRIVAIGMLFVVASCFVNVLPFLMYGAAGSSHKVVSRNKTEIEVCDIGSRHEMCEEEDIPPTVAAVTMFFLAGVLQSFGGLSYYTVGLVYMDDNTEKRNSPIYMAICITLRIFGPILGYMMSSAFLKFNENPFAHAQYGADDPRWIGGWWMGFVVEGPLLLLFTLPLAMFPRRLPSKNTPLKADTKKRETFRQMLLGLVPALRRLFKNPIFILLTINSVMVAMGGVGHYLMLPRYMENQFRLTASDASLYSGPPGLVAVQIAVLAGGFMMWKYRPSVKLLTAGLALSDVIGAVGFLVLMIPKCQTVNLSNSGLNSDGLNLLNQCNSKCLCSTAAFTPICGVDKNTMYFSPCHAGCTEVQDYNDTQVFRNCSCVVDASGNFFTADSLEKGFCFDENCWSRALAYIILLPTLYGVTNILRIAHTIVFLRSIDPGDKSAALGAFDTIVTLFGFLPSPIIIGALLDSTCLVFEKSCGRTGNCWLYDMDKFNYMLHGTFVVLCVFSAMCLVGVCLLCSRLHDLYKEDESDNCIKTEQITNF